MRILDIRERTFSVGSPLRNARVDFSEMTSSIVAVVTDQFRDGRRVVGHAFNSFGRYACGGPLRERFIPRLIAADPNTLIDPASGWLDPARCVATILRREKPGAHAERSMAVGTLELALWDIVGKLHGEPLHRVLGKHFGVPGSDTRQRVPCYVGGGFYNQADDLARLDAEIASYLDAGYTAVKIKAGGLPTPDDLRRIESVLKRVGPGDRLALDASCAFGRDEALGYAAAVAPYGLRWLEEPCDPADFETYRAVADAYPGVVAGGENLFSVEEADNFLRYGRFGGRIVLQPDPPLAYGIGEFVRIVDTALRHGVQRHAIVPHGGNMMSLHVTAGLDLGSAESYPGLFAPFGGFSDEVEIADGFATLPQAPGIGFERQPALYALMRDLAA